MSCVCIGGGGPPRGLTWFWTPPRTYWSEVKQSPACGAEKACAVCGALTGAGAPRSRVSDRPSAASRGVNRRPPGAEARRERTTPLGRPAPEAWTSVGLRPPAAAAPAAQQIGFPSPSWRRLPVGWPLAWRPESRLPRPSLPGHAPQSASSVAPAAALLASAGFQLRLCHCSSHGHGPGLSFSAGLPRYLLLASCDL